MSTRIARIERASPRSADAIVTLEDGRALALLRDTVAACALRKGDDFPPEVEARALAIDQRDRCRLAAWRSIARGPVAVEQLRRKLLQKEFAAPLVDETLARLRDAGHLDDAAFSQALARKRTKHNRRGPRAIAQELLQAGVARDTAAEALTPHRQRESQHDAAMAALRRWTGARRHTDPARRRKAAADFLLRRGFDGSIVWDVVREWAKGAPADD
jgi:regulatory protein